MGFSLQRNCLYCFRIGFLAGRSTRESTLVRYHSNCRNGYAHLLYDSLSVRHPDQRIDGTWRVGADQIDVVCISGYRYRQSAGTVRCEIEDINPFVASGKRFFEYHCAAHGKPALCHNGLPATDDHWNKSRQAHTKYAATPRYRIIDLSQSSGSAVICFSKSNPAGLVC